MDSERKQGSKENKDPIGEKMKISLSLKKKSGFHRFGSPTNANRFQKAAEGVVLDNTKFCTNWAIHTFLE